MNILRSIVFTPVIKHGAGLFANTVCFRVGQFVTGRRVSRFVADLEAFNNLSIDQQKQITRARLAGIVEHAVNNVPYYKDIAAQIGFDIEKIKKDEKYLQDFPKLTKEVIQEQSVRLLAKPLDNTKHFACKTGGSTGQSCVIYYDVDGADRSAAITRYARNKIGKRYHRSELHFACDFGDKSERTIWQKETLKCIAMNRSNIFFGEIDDAGIMKILHALRQRRPFIVHGHPSTLFHVAQSKFVEDSDKKLFSVFEPSGELCSEKMHKKISNVFGCKIHNRYGLAEFGVVAYQYDHSHYGLKINDSDYFVESSDTREIVATGFYNKLMPLIRYCTGDTGDIEHLDGKSYVCNLTGRLHDKVEINGKIYLTHFVQDIIDHRVLGVADWQIVQHEADLHFLINEENPDDRERISSVIKDYFGDKIKVKFVNVSAFHRVGRHNKFRHLVQL